MAQPKNHVADEMRRYPWTYDGYGWELGSPPLTQALLADIVIKYDAIRR